MRQNRLRKRSAVLALLNLGLLSASVGCQQTTRFDYAEKTLSNGLRVIALEDFGTPVVAVQVWYHVGSKNENPERQGFAHMFEHMMFRGTDRLGPKEHFEAIRRVGGDCNAYTSFDQTVYVQKLPSNQMELAMYLESERMAFLKIDQDSFSTERQVVEEERRQGLNQPYGTVMERALPQIFTKHSYKWTPIGQIPHLRKASADELARFWETYYVPNNATLVVVGAVKKEEVLKRAEKYFGWIPRGEGEVPKVTEREPEQKEAREIKITVVPPKEPLTIVVEAYRAVPMSHPDSVPLNLLCSILGGGESSRLNQLLVKEKNIALAAGAETFALEQDGLAGAGALLKPMGGDKKNDVLAIIKEQIEKVKAQGVTSEELEKAKLNTLKGMVGSAQTVEDRAKLIGEYAVLYGDLARLNKRFDEVRAVTLDDIKRVANTYFVETKKNTVLIEPGGIGEMLKAAATKQDDGPPPVKIDGNPVVEKQGPKKTAVRPANFPTTSPVAKVLDTFPETKTSEKVLANGLKVVVVPEHQIPLVTFTLGVKTGSATETAGTVGHASMAAGLVTQGTEKYTSRELAETLDRNAISLGASVGTDVGAVNASCLTEQSELTMQLLAEVTLRPTFPQKEFDQAKEQSLAGLTVSEQNPKYLADRELRKRVYGEHPYGRSSAGESADVKKLTRDDVAKWWKTAIRPDNSVLYVAGDISPEHAFEMAEKYLGGWKAEGTPLAPIAAKIPERKPTTIYLIDKPGLVQSEIRFAQLAIDRKDPRWPAARVLTQIFGGQFGSRLMETVRVKKGLTYGIYGYFKPEKDAGTLEVTTFSKTPTTAETVAATIEEIVRMKTAPITEEEMSTAKNYLIGSFAGQRETPQAVINDLWLLEYANLPADYMKNMLAGVARTEESNVRQLANDLMDEKQMVIVVVGDASKIKADLEKLGPVEVIKPETSAPTTQP